MKPLAKYCPACQQTKPAADFYARGLRRGLSGYCKECQRAHTRARNKRLYIRKKPPA